MVDNIVFTAICDTNNPAPGVGFQSGAGCCFESALNLRVWLGGRMHRVVGQGFRMIGAVAKLHEGRSRYCASAGIVR